MSAWLPTAERIPAYRDAGVLAMDAPRCLWIASGLGGEYSARLTAEYSNAYLCPPHLIYDPRNDEVIQMVPADRRATWVASEGIQVVVCETTQECPFPPKGEEFESLSGLAGVLGWLRDLGVPDFCPLGPAVPSMPKAAGKAAGHYSSEGKIDVGRLVRSRIP